LFCFINEVWQELHYLYILKRYLNEQPTISVLQRKNYINLTWIVVAMVLHDICGLVIYISISRTSPTLVASSNTHFLLVGVLFHMMLNVTFPKRSSQDMVSTEADASRLSIVPIPMSIEIEKMDYSSFEFRTCNEPNEYNLELSINFDLI
jgi:hypothetical protein